MKIKRERQHSHQLLLPHPYQQLLSPRPVVHIHREESLKQKECQIVHLVSSLHLSKIFFLIWRSVSESYGLWRCAH